MFSRSVRADPLERARTLPGDELISESIDAVLVHDDHPHRLDPAASSRARPRSFGRFGRR
jgi:hypothetical protein